LSQSRSARQTLEDTLRLEQLHARSGMERDLEAPGYAHQYGPARIDLLGDRATSTHYVRTYDSATRALERLAYGRWQLERDAGGRWVISSSQEIPTGDARGPGFLVEALGPPLGATPTRADADRDADELAIRNVLASYGIAADGGSSRLVSSLYTEDTHCDIEGTMILDGRPGLAQLFDGAAHQSLLPWSAHTMGASLIQVEEHRAVSTHYSRTYGRVTGRSFPGGAQDRALWRFSVNRWEFVREQDGHWRISRRVSRSPEHAEMKALLGRGLSEERDATERRPDQGAHDASDARACQRLVTAFGMALDCDDFASIERLFADEAIVEFDARPVDIGRGMQLGPSRSGQPLVANIAEAAVVYLQRDRAALFHPLYRYTRAERGHYPLDGIAYGCWRLVRNARGQWRATRATFHSAGSPGASGLLSEALADAGAKAHGLEVPS
jgi:hypothetical protein